LDECLYTHLVNDCCIIFFFQISLILKGMTSIENDDVHEAKREADLVGKDFRFKYDLGHRENLITFFGPDFTIWVYPFATKIYADGLDYKVARVYGEITDA